MNYYLIAAVLAATGYLALRRLSRAPPPTSYPEVSDPDFVSNNSTMREIRGRKLRVFELKRNEKGPWLVFIHGLGGTLSQFSDQLENFKEFNILAFDYVGHGKSEVLEDFAAYTTNSLLNDLLALLEPLRGPIVLIAHSYGTSLAILACNALPRAPVGLVLLGVGNPNIPKSAFEKINSLAKRTPEFLIETWRNLFERPGGLESPSVKRFLGPHATEEMKRRQYVPPFIFIPGFMGLY